MRPAPSGRPQRLTSDSAVIEILLKGIAAGFIVAVPLGPAGILCFRRVLAGPRLVGVLTVLGAALADSIYGTAAAFGLTAVVRALLTHREGLRAAGGVLLIVLAVQMIRARTPEEAQESSTGSLPGAFFSAFLLMAANPSVIVSFLAVFAALDLGAVRGYSEMAWLGPGVFAGSAAWWFVYTLARWGFKHKLGGASLHIIDVVAGFLVGAFGVWQLIELLRGR
jgi:threonine/homoserine/homoserine lactone efflux protein